MHPHATIPHRVQPCQSIPRSLIDLGVHLINLLQVILLSNVAFELEGRCQEVVRYRELAALKVDVLDVLETLEVVLFAKGRYLLQDVLLDDGALAQLLERQVREFLALGRKVFEGVLVGNDDSNDRGLKAVAMNVGCKVTIEPNPVTEINFSIHT